ncbi:hypothetical protein FTX39_02620 [Escherichia coli]|nr:hypothetical protein [Escherichia coli]
MNQRNMSIINSTPVRVIAIVGCDGSGKSTLTASLVNELAARMPTERIGNDSNLLIVFYVQIMPDDLVMQLHRF